MTDLATTLSVQPGDHTGVITAEDVQTPTVITEHQILIGSAAALAGPTVRRSRFRTAVQALFTSADKAETPEKHKTTKHYPKRYSFIEDASMSRMMDRL